MSHSHKKGLALGAFICLTGCDPAAKMYELTPDQKAQVQQMIDDNARVLPIYAQLIDKVDSDAVFGAEGTETKEAFYADLQTADALVRQYQLEGRIYGFDADNATKKTADAAAFFHSDVNEKAQFIGVLVSGSGEVSASGHDLLHEGGHDVMGDHAKEVQNYAETLTASNENYETGDFSLLVEKDKDFCYLVSVLGSIPETLLESTRERLANMSIDSLNNDFAEGYENSGHRLTALDFYNDHMNNPLAQDQLSWATYMMETTFLVHDYSQDQVGEIIDFTNDPLQEQFTALGLEPSELTDILAHETSVYPQMHKEYMESLAEFRREHEAEMIQEQRTETRPPTIRFR